MGVDVLYFYFWLLLVVFLCVSLIQINTTVAPFNSMHILKPFHKILLEVIIVIYDKINTLKCVLL